MDPPALRALADRLGLDLGDAAGAVGEPVERPRGHVVQHEGDRCDRVSVLVVGAARAYAIDDEGEERVAWFAFEGDVLGSVAALTGGPAPETIELLEPSTLVAVDVAALRPRLGRDAAATALALALVAEHARAVEEEARALRSLSAAERYALLLEREPEVVGRVRVRDLASYLGVARETLSRIRAGGGR